MASPLVIQKIEATEKDFEALRGQFTQGLLSHKEYVSCLIDTVEHYKQELLVVPKELFEELSELDKLYKALYVLNAMEDYLNGITIPELVTKLVKLVPTTLIRPAETTMEIPNE